MLLTILGLSSGYINEVVAFVFNPVFAHNQSIKSVYSELVPICTTTHHDIGGVIGVIIMEGRINPFGKSNNVTPEGGNWRRHDVNLKNVSGDGKKHSVFRNAKSSQSINRKALSSPRCSPARARVCGNPYKYQNITCRPCSMRVLI